MPQARSSQMVRGRKRKAEEKKGWRTVREMRRWRAKGSFQLNCQQLRLTTVVCINRVTWFSGKVFLFFSPHHIFKLILIFSVFLQYISLSLFFQFRKINVLFFDFFSYFQCLSTLKWLPGAILKLFIQAKLLRV